MTHLSFVSPLPRTPPLEEGDPSPPPPARPPAAALVRRVTDENYDSRHIALRTVDSALALLRRFQRT
ncbi:MAG: hypothetical protein IPK79_06940 [Vampirovibrionales bacterium]|nr:hypothetical protein [Vampirovibrionales bacterium]